ncbi:DUF722 domain-containing protein [Lactococcus garvieae]|uniref:DUF722 domain-containing protein n=1 Tax=Lactococcus garvieae TaxID=1363 RepID=UPI0038550DC3
MPKIDRLDKLIRDYVKGHLDKRIEARIEQLTYKSRVDNMGIRTAFNGDSEQLRKVLLEEKIEEDKLILSLKHEKYQVEACINCSDFKNARQICEARWRKDMPQWELQERYSMSRSTIYREYNKLKKTIIRWSGFEV